jgi:putative membrane protein
MPHFEKPPEQLQMRVIMMAPAFFYRILCGFFLGVSVFAPGFSGSIIAISMGIYQDLLRIISNPLKQLKQNVKYCLPLVIGVAISAILFVLTFKYLFETYEKATYLLFVGLVAGNLPTIFSEVKNNSFKKHYLVGGIAAFAAALSLGVFTTEIEQISSIGILHVSWFILALGGFAGGVTALIPGMSVSMVLMVMGVYSQLIFVAESLLRLDFEYLLPFGRFCVFALAGLVSASSIIKLIFKKYPGFSHITVFGFISGSLIGILIQSLQINDVNFSWWLGGIMLAAGLGISMLFVVLGKIMKKASTPSRQKVE